MAATTLWLSPFWDENLFTFTARANTGLAFRALVQSREDQLATVRAVDLGQNLFALLTALFVFIGLPATVWAVSLFQRMLARGAVPSLAFCSLENLVTAVRAFQLLFLAEGTVFHPSINPVSIAFMINAAGITTNGHRQP